MTAIRTLEDLPELIVDHEGSDRQYWKDVVDFRDLFYFLAWRDIVIRYKQTVIGIGWAVIQPLLTMAIFTVVFGRIAKLDSGPVPYPILVLSGVLAWQFVSQSIGAASSSLVGSANMVSKVYFPRMLVPAATIAVSVVDLGVALLLLGAIMAGYSFAPSLNILALPVFIAIAAVLALGVGVWLSALAVKYRDVRFAVPFAIQLGLFVSPVGFSTSVIDERWRLLFALNPMVGIIEGFRWAIIGGSVPFPAAELAISLLLSILILVLAVRFFRRTERTLADII